MIRRATIMAGMLTMFFASAAHAQSLINPKLTLAENLSELYKIAVPIIAILAFLAVIYAGYIYITSLGDPGRINEAKAWIIAAVTGVALILLVPVIINTLCAIPNLPGGVDPNCSQGTSSTSGSTSTGTQAPDTNVPGTPEQGVGGGSTGGSGSESGGSDDTVPGIEPCGITGIC